MRNLLFLAVILGLLIFVLTACAGEPKVVERVVIQEVKVEVPVKCPAVADPRPDYPDLKERLRGLPIHEQVKRFLAARELRGPYEDQLERALRACQ